LVLLDSVERVARDTPPVENFESRFGNLAFRMFYDCVSEISPELHTSLPGLPSEAIEELSVCFSEAWGNRMRIDFGSGMELNFLCWLLCLEWLQVLRKTDHRAIIIRLFWRYINTMRILQSTYWLEPAGSHGVWGLDDCHSPPFLFGHKYTRPKAIHYPEMVVEYLKDYMYFTCIAFINSAPSLRWHSPMLNDISAMRLLPPFPPGMLKMYLAEVLNKLPL
ncbi:uncharacterized protein LACBIDRAFT_167127, partial [Laccaria bicolor S238N-H82]